MHLINDLKSINMSETHLNNYNITIEDILTSVFSLSK